MKEKTPKADALRAQREQQQRDWEAMQKVEKAKRAIAKKGKQK